MKRFRTKILLSVLGFYSITAGHPHMFIDVSLKFVLNDSGLSGFYVYWEMDEMNSAWVIEDHDKNRNGVFEKSEQKDIFTKSFSNAASQNYFMRVSWGLNLLDTSKITKFTAAINMRQFLTYSFYVPCNLHIREIEGKKISVLFEDPTIYIAFTIKKEFVQVSTNDCIEGKIIFKKIDYSDAVIIILQRK